MVSLWFLVELVQIYQMTYRYMGVISLPYSQKLRVYTFVDIATCGGGYFLSTPPSPPPQGLPLVKFDGEFIATINNFYQVKKFSHGINIGILTAIEWFFCGSR